MSLLNPLFLFGSLVLAVPILVHLVKNDKSEIVRFSSLMFLLRIPKKAIRQQKLRNLLLMAMRLLLIALLVAAFARPYIVRSDDALVPDSGDQAVVIMMDNSYSMTYGTTFERMKDEAISRIDGLAPGEPAALVAFSDRATLLGTPTDDPAELTALVDALAPTANRTSYYEAFALADRVLAQLAGYDRELVVISDFQRNGWTRTARESVIDANVRTKLVDLGVENPDNVGIDSVGVDATVFTRTYEGQLLVRVNNHDLARPAAVSVILEIDDRVVDRQEVAIPADSSVLAEFTGFDLPMGYSRGRVQIEDADELASDNDFRFVILRRDRLRVLIADAGRSEQSFFLEQAFTSAPDLPFEIDVRPVSNLTAADLADFEVVIINDVPRLTDEFRDTLDELRAQGQGQLVFLGENANIEWWNTYGALPVRLGPKIFVERDRDQAFYSLTTYERSHEVFSPLEEGARLTLNTARFFAYSEIEPKEGAVTVASFEDGSAAIVDSSADDPGLLVIGSPVDNVWNDLPLNVSFLPVIHEIARYLARYNDSNSWYQLGEAVPVTIGGDETAALIDPNGDRITLAETSTTGRRFFTPDLAGFHELRVGPETTRIAVNAPTSESVLERMVPDDLLASVQRLEGEVTRGALLAEADGNGYAERQNWWWYLFLFALLLGIGEIYLGNHVTETVSQRSPAPPPGRHSVTLGSEVSVVGPRQAIAVDHSKEP